MISNDDVKIDNLPIIILNDWSELSNELNNEFKNQKLSKLTVDYYNNIIKI
jgi:hypothetical protein